MIKKKQELDLVDMHIIKRIIVRWCIRGSGMGQNSKVSTLHRMIGIISGNLYTFSHYGQYRIHTEIFDSVRVRWRQGQIQDFGKRGRVRVTVKY